MASEIQVVVRATQTWLQSSWHVQVPFAWLEACVEWLQEEAGGAGRLSQQQINQQALDQWLLTDLRDLDYPVLPEGLAQAQKTELRGIFCVQVDSLLDISQPAYGQLQKCRGTACANDEVSAITQTTQRPWEARTSRMLLLQVTDGVQSLEAMEYQPIPALSSALRPGAKLQLQGSMICRLGMLLLGSSNVKVLGGEVEDLVDRNNQDRVLCRTLGLPEEQRQQDGQEAQPSQEGSQDFEDLELNDQDLLASLEAQEEVERPQVLPVRDSGYRTLSEPSTQSLRSSSVRSLSSSASSRNEPFARSYRSGLTQSSADGSVQSHRYNDEPDESDLIDHSSSDHVIQQVNTDHNMADEDFPDEEFDDLPLDELDSVIFQESTNATTQSDSGHRSMPDDECDFMDEDINCFLEEVDSCGVQTREPDVHQGPSREYATNQTETSDTSFKVTCKSSRNATDMFSIEERSHSVPQRQSHTLSTAEFQRLSAKNEVQDDNTVPVVAATSPPFTYLCLLDEQISKPHLHPREICVKAFIVTLLGKLSSNNGVWRVSATISDGTGYLDVELSDMVLIGLLGFSVVEKDVLKHNPARRHELDAGMRRCQEDLVDMCCLMTITTEPEGRKAVVTKADPVNEKILQELETRVRDNRK